jgi:hypothetical protein
VSGQFGAGAGATVVDVTAALATVGLAFRVKR